MESVSALDRHASDGGEYRNSHSYANRAAGICTLMLSRAPYSTLKRSLGGMVDGMVSAPRRAIAEGHACWLMVTANQVYYDQLGLQGPDSQLDF